MAAIVSFEIKTYPGQSRGRLAVGGSARQEMPAFCAVFSWIKDQRFKGGLSVLRSRGIP